MKVVPFRRRVIDLSHPLSPQIPVWPGDPRPAFVTLATTARHGYALQQIMLGEHSGTHLGCARHLQEDGLTVEQLAAEELIVPAVVVDGRAQVVDDPDWALLPAMVTEWERQYGRIAAGSAILLLTGWDRRWPDANAYFNYDEQGTMHYPGFAPETVAWLIEERAICGLGCDTAGIDPGRDRTLASNRLLLQGRRWHLENLTRLDELPPTGAWLFIGALPIVGGTGSSARVLALAP
jgi:kynurenine formamidase